MPNRAIKTADLAGQDLNLVVHSILHPDSTTAPDDLAAPGSAAFSELIDRDGILCGPSPFPGSAYAAGIGTTWDDAIHIQTGSSRAEAVLRCFAASRLGLEVTLAETIPSEAAETSRTVTKTPIQSLSTPPHLNYRVERAAMNSAKLSPPVGKRFSLQESTELKDWVTRAGFQAWLKGHSVYVVGDDAPDIPDGLFEQRAAKAVAKEIAQQEVADAVASARTKEYRELPASQWIESKMGPRFANSFNKLMLARFLDGKDEFKGLMGSGWIDPLTSLGLNSLNGELKNNDVLAFLKQSYDKFAKSVKPTLSTAEQSLSENCTGDHVVVSFRAECQDDVDRLIESMNADESLRGLFDVREVAPLLFPGVKVEMQLASPMTTDHLGEAMRILPDGHVMYRTLQELPLAKNHLKERIFSFATRNWKSQEHPRTAADNIPNF